MGLLEQYLWAAFISMIPVIELRGGKLYAQGAGLDFWWSLLICAVANMLPVPIIYFFARKVLVWGADKKYIGRIFNFFLVKGERAGQKLRAKAGRRGLFWAMVLFVGIPIPGTGAWTGTLGASFLNMGIRSTAVSVSLGVLMAGVIVGLASLGVFSFLGI